MTDLRNMDDKEPIGTAMSAGEALKAIHAELMWGALHCWKSSSGVCRFCGEKYLSFFEMTAHNKANECEHGNTCPVPHLQRVFDIIHLVYASSDCHCAAHTKAVQVGAAPSEGMKAICPKCGSNEIRFWKTNADTYYVGCFSCKEQFSVFPWKEGLPDFAQFFALSPARSGEPPTADVPDLYRLAYIPGMWRCPKCEFVLCKSTLSMSVGAMGTTEADRQGEECPNDGTWMVPVTYKESCATLTERLEKLTTKPAAAPQPVSGDAPKVEGVWLLECDWHYGQGFQPFGECFYDSEEEANAARLHFKIPKDYRAVKYGPYFPPASQTPPICDCCGAGPMLDRGGFYDCFACGHNREKLATPASTARPDGWIDPENYVAWCRRSRNTIVTCDSDAPGAFKVYRLAAPGSVPHAPDSPNKPPCPNCGCNHFRGENTLCNDGVPQAEPPKCETCGSSDPSPGLCSSTWHLQARRKAGAAQPGDDKQEGK